MISLTFTVLFGISGLIALFSGAVGPGLGALVIAGLFLIPAQIEMERADQRRRDKFLVSYEKAQREDDARRAARIENYGYDF
jgi:hypothetical protein